MTVLLAEDDPYTREGLTDIFEGEGYQVIAASDGEEALDFYKESSPDFIILDIMMPGKNGYDVCKEIRKTDHRVPVVFLSAKSEEIDKVLGLELGADDYIAKPFGIKEVTARVRAITRRVLASEGADKKTESNSPGDVRNRVFSLGDLLVHPAELKAFRGKREIELSLRDIKILALFAANRGKVLSRNDIYNAGWGMSHIANSRTLDQHISQLRKKIEKDPKNPEIILTVHTAGYRYP